MDKYYDKAKEAELKEVLRKSTISAMNSGGILVIDYISPIKDQLRGLNEIDSEDFFPMKNVLTKGWLYGQVDPKLAMIRSDDKINHDGTCLFVKEYGVTIVTDFQSEDEAKK
mmetsp:Transcript_54388/g.45810  ORF Transcript_54388/g.45810 Transcript_54388/m.45810 type:complete len:112 (-) Transcript_54388:61-396(-)